MTKSDMPTILIRPESKQDFDAIGQVNRLAFGGDGEARLVDALRKGNFVRVSLVAEIDGRVVGHILFSDLKIVAEDRTVPALALAPTAVLPEHQRMGVGSELIRRGLDVCRTEGHRIVLVVGHPEYYPRFGFSPELARKLDSPYAGEAFMALELTEGALEDVVGRVEYAQPFSDLS